jgi:hypothetical protein
MSKAKTAIARVVKKAKKPKTLSSELGEAIKGFFAAKGISKYGVVFLTTTPDSENVSAGQLLNNSSGRDVFAFALGCDKLKAELMKTLVKAQR